MENQKSEPPVTNEPRVRARPLRKFLDNWSPFRLRKKIRKLERRWAEHKCKDEFRRPFPVYVGGDPRFEGAEAIFCRIEIGERQMMTRQGPKPTECFIMSEDQSGTELEVIGDAYKLDEAIKGDGDEVD